MSPRPAQWPAIGFGALGATLTAAAALSAGSAPSDALSVAVPVLMVVVTLLAVARFQPAHRTIWVVHTTGLALVALGELSSRWSSDGVPAAPGSPTEVAFVAGGALVAVALARRVRAREPVRDLVATLDAVVVSVAGCAVCWTFVFHPLLTDDALRGPDLAWALAAPAMDVVLFAVVVRFVLSVERGNPSAALLGAGLLGYVLLDLTYQVAGRAGLDDQRTAVDAGFLLAYTAIGAAALHPSMADIGRVGRVSRGRAGWQRRTWALYLTALVPPFVLLAAMAGVGPIDRAGLVGPIVATVVAFVVVLMRISTVVGDVQDSTVKRGEDRFEALVEHSTDVIAVVDSEGTIQYVSPAFHAALGRDPETHVGSALRTIAHPDDVAGLTALLFQISHRPPHSTSQFETRLLAADGTIRHFEVVASNLVGDQIVDGLALTMRDITDRKALEGELSHQAFHDSLTGLANRALFTDRVEHALHRRWREPSCSVSVLFVDLDDFKAVNDGLGHAAGDALLRAVGQRIVSCLRVGDTASRLGGDEFAVLLEDDALDGQALMVAQRILAVLQEPVPVGDMELGVVASIGIAVAAGEVDTVGLLRDADIAMYEAKRTGKGRACVFDPTMRDAASARLSLQTDLTGALAGGQFRLVYQPIVDLTTGLVGGAEALLRWQHPEQGNIPPDVFIPVAESTGMVVPIGEWVMHEACNHAARSGSTVCVNVSGVQFAAPGFLDSVSMALASSGLVPPHLTVEITETALMVDTDATARILDELRGIGVRVAIDDFGTGYCSLAYLQRFAVDVVKIDRAFVAEVDGASRGDGLARSIMHMAASLGVGTVVAEGIETDDQLARLIAMGCRHGQGYLLSRPLEVGDYDALLAEHQAEVAAEASRPSRPDDGPHGALVEAPDAGLAADALAASR